MLAALIASAGLCAQPAHAQAVTNGPVKFAPGFDISGGSVRGVSALDAQDLDGDGYVDVGVFEGGLHAGGRVTFAWFRSPAKGGQTWTRYAFTLPSPMRPFIGAARFGDVDHDGDYDLVVAMDNHSGTTKSAYIYWLENPRPARAATTAWTVRQVRADLAVDHINDMDLADMDGDGRLDVVVRALDPNQLLIYFQNGPASWTERSLDTAAFGATGEGFALGNLDRQGNTDISIAGHWLQAPSAARTGPYVAHVIDAQYATINANTKEDIADIDRDGRMDVVISPAEGYRDGGNHLLAWYRGPTNPVSATSWQRTVVASNYNGAHTVELADMDGDGDLDLVSGVAWALWGQTQSVSVFYNLGAGAFGNRQTLAAGRGLYSGVVRDLFADGDLDIIGPDTYSGESHPYIYESCANQASPCQGPANVPATPASLPWFVVAAAIALCAWQSVRVQARSVVR